MKRLVLYIYTMFVALTAMACQSKEIKFMQDWDKTFPKSEKVKHEKVTFKTQYGLTLAADLYIPKNAEGKLPAIAVSGPFGAVKEQCSGLYAPAARLTPTPVSSITSTKSVRLSSLCMERKHIPVTSERVPSDI